MRYIVLSVALSVLLSSGVSAEDSPTTPAAVADAKPDATLRLMGGSVAAGIGYVWGHGKLVYHGEEHRLHISGISLLNAGVAHLSAFGAVYNLKDLHDLNGTYLASSEGLAIVSGTSGFYLKNGRGVVIKLLAATKGVQFNLGADGISVELDM
ncbi:MAG: hypothetical protein ABSF86_23215 [Steroidobacteraceae bacterium]|jgi:hypothetical protein